MHAEGSYSAILIPAEHAVDLSLYMVGMVVVTQYWPDEDAEHYDQWLKENCLVARVSEPLWQD